MDNDREKSGNQDEEIAPIDKIEERVEAEMKAIEGRAKERAGQGMQDEALEREGRKLQEKAEEELEQQRGNS
ncbi:MAG TPA: hypothetical protein VE262_23505 [Blastocatellia bacterium]|nr:hypothetical protein [Blastocatellia bacterium]